MDLTSICWAQENQKYMVDEAISLLKKTGNTKFKESIDVAINLGIDPKQTEQNVRGSVVLPNGTGKNMRVIVFAESVDAEAAKTAGADEVGAEDLAEKIKAGFVVDAENHKKLANTIKMVSIMDEAEREDIGLRGGIYVRKNYDRNIHADIMSTILENASR